MFAPIDIHPIRIWMKLWGFVFWAAALLAFSQYAHAPHLSGCARYGAFLIFRMTHLIIRNSEFGIRNYPDILKVFSKELKLFLASESTLGIIIQFRIPHSALRIPHYAFRIQNAIPPQPIAHSFQSGRACGTPGYILRMKRLPGVSI